VHCSDDTTMQHTSAPSFEISRDERARAPPGAVSTTLSCRCLLPETKVQSSPNPEHP
jgi:hypothetical protein